MILLGTIVNAAAIVASSVAGQLLPKPNANVSRTVTQGIALALCILGLMMALRTEMYLWMAVSLAAGGWIGEWAQLERRFGQFGDWLERKVTKRAKGKAGNAFAASSLVFCTGAMAIMGAIDSGTRDSHEILLTKAIMDGLLALLFTSTLGIGVIFSAGAVFVYEGAIALTAYWAASHVPEDALRALVTEISAVGGVLILGLGIQLLEICTIRVANLLPSVVVMAVAMLLIH